MDNAQRMWRRVGLCVVLMGLELLPSVQPAMAAPGGSPSETILAQEDSLQQRRRRRRVAPRTNPSQAAPGTPRRSAPIDLSTLDKSPSPTTTAPSAPAPSGSSRDYGPRVGQSGLPTPNFKMLYDLWLIARPGDSPLTFQNIHSFLLVEFLPVKDVQFSFEVATSPRFYELDYQISPAVQLRLGKIFIPFDQLDPHNRFGGRVNVTAFTPTGGSAFLPDVWADLGIGLKIQWLDTKALGLVTHFYVVNGFGDTGTDPVTYGGATNPTYPNFNNTLGIDNNDDKALGGRFEANFFRGLVGGVSVYTQRYTDHTKESARIFMLGFDGNFRLARTRTEVSAGFVNMNAGLLSPAPADANSFLRGGIYGQVQQGFGENWKFGFRLGSSQNDNRVIDVTDQTIVGGWLGRRMGIFDLRLEYFRDFNKVTGKTLYSVIAGRFVIFL
ncbi:MAG: hypothetical protein AB7F66_00750 [Bacteriovoracia bacterium]